MSRLRRRPAAALLTSLALLVAGCASGKGESAPPPVNEPASTSTSVADAAEEPPPTTVPPPTAPPTTPAPLQSVPSAGPAPKAMLTTTGVVVPVLGREGDGLVVGTPCGATAVLSRGTPIDGTVVLDAGHGGVEPGAVGPNGLTEATLNLAVVGFARQALEAAGVPVVLTRSGDYRITLEARAKIVNTVKPKAFVSIHHNAAPDGPRDGPGSETYYQTKGTSSAESKRLSGLIYEEIVTALSQYHIAWVADTDAGAKYRKSASGDDYYGIIRRTQGTPASLAELAFVSNPPEAELLARPEVQKVEGEAVARALVRFLTTKDPGSGFTEPYPRETPAGGGGGARNCRDPDLG